MTDFILGEKKLKQISQTIFNLSSADQTEVLIGGGRTTSIRFANSFIHQPTTRLGNWLKIRLIFGKKIGVVSGNQLDKKNLVNLVNRATQICRFQKADSSFKSLPQKRILKKLNLFDEKTASASVKSLAQKANVVIKKAKEKKLIASGNLTRSINELAIANSLGVWAFQKDTYSRLSTIIMGQAGSGYSSDMGWRLNQIDEKTIAEKATQKALNSQNPADLKPGEYEVILEAAALEELLNFFAWLGPNARIYHEDVSYFKNRLGRKVFSPQLTIVDDPFDKRGLPISFDYEGQPKKKLVIIKNGVIKSIAYDSYYAQKYRKSNTGHALPAPNTFGPILSHLIIKPGKSNLSQMISSCRKGLLVTRLWYIRVVHFGEMLLTGMTRDGLFLIENGRIVKPVKNLRFTESIPRMFKNIVEIGRDLSPQPSWGNGAYLVPPMRIANFRFTSKTDF